MASHNGACQHLEKLITDLAESLKARWKTRSM
jgi:hypothetical protein